VTSQTLSIGDIHIGERARTDLGDLNALKNSISNFGLLQPVIVTTDHRLIAGHRRLEACRGLGMTEVPAMVAEHITDAVALLTAERDENTCRKDMTVTERLAIGARIEELKRPDAAARKAEGQVAGGHARHGLLSSSAGGKQAEAAPERNRKGETAVLAAEAVGMSRTAYHMAKRIKKHAEDPHRPESVRQAAREALADLPQLFIAV